MMTHEKQFNNGIWNLSHWLATESHALTGGSGIIPIMIAATEALQTVIFRFSCCLGASGHSRLIRSAALNASLSSAKFVPFAKEYWHAKTTFVWMLMIFGSCSCHCSARVAMESLENFTSLSSHVMKTLHSRCKKAKKLESPTTKL